MWSHLKFIQILYEKTTFKTQKTHNFFLMARNYLNKRLEFCILNNANANTMQMI